MQLNKLTDKQLAVIVREENKEIYSEIIRRYESKLARYLRKFIYDKDELEDVLQAVFIKIYKNLYGFDAKRKFSSWIYRIAHNEAVNALRKNINGNITLEDIEYKIIDKQIFLNEIGKIIEKFWRELSNYFINSGCPGFCGRDFLVILKKTGKDTGQDEKLKQVHEEMEKIKDEMKGSLEKNLDFLQKQSAATAGLMQNRA